MSSTATIRLSVDPATGKRTVTINYNSDADALPHEHEEAHAELVEKIFEGGLAKPGDKIVVEREAVGKVDETPAGEEAVDQRQTSKEGGS
jgi:hypothetical protein